MQNICKAKKAKVLNVKGTENTARQEFGFKETEAEERSCSDESEESDVFWTLE